ncbi:hypothetical protein PspLS_09968 [Pyricularia sp. CBS 133598]|nr:hypothetical protein PspLS_09968 [Pyricularia sp. CBS 133598]
MRPLFSAIPAEVCLEIFRLSLTPRMVPWDLRHRRHHGNQTPLPDPASGPTTNDLSPEGPATRTVTKGRVCQCVTFLAHTDVQYTQRVADTVHQWTLRWTPRRYDGPEVYSYGGLVSALKADDLVDEGAQVLNILGVDYYSITIDVSSAVVGITQRKLPIPWCTAVE